MKNETQNHIIAQKAKRLQRRVCELLGWDAMQYAEFIYNSGRNYLLYYTNGDTFMTDQIERSRIFWSWWKNHWVLRDEAFVHNEQIGYLHRQNLLLLYLQTHDARILATEIRPSGLLLKETYATMMGELIKNEVSHE
ncbi:MAG: hypothetical protein EKK39_14775 [Sphingobacteriales bacterium]|nr:MAG: hypothetical protein EKK39_14775 [Sphingobacteriales bacterium]